MNMKKTLAFIGILMLFACRQEQKVEVGQKTSKHHLGYNNFPVSVLDQDRSGR